MTANDDAQRSQERSASAVQFRAFDVTDTEEAIKLLSIGRPERYRDLKRQLFDWQFLNNPHADGRSPFLVGELDGRIVALNGFMPARVRVHGRAIEACWSCDTYVSGEFRGKGIGKHLISNVTRAAPLMLGYGISDMSDPIFEKLEWRLHPNVELLFFHAAERGVRGRIKNAASRVASLRSLGIGGPDVEVWDSLSGHQAAQLDELWIRNAADFPSAVQRDGAYLRWKYFEHPFYQYRAYVMRAGDALTAALIARHDPTESVIADYSGPADDEITIASLATEVVHELDSLGTTRIKCESTHQPLLGALKRVGFISSPHGSRFRVRVNAANTDPFDGWLLMPGDSDGDLLAPSSLASEEAASRRSEDV
jgi:GNAT superfamily N-acetyltransferase